MKKILKIIGIAICVIYFILAFIQAVDSTKTGMQKSSITNINNI